MLIPQVLHRNYLLPPASERYGKVMFSVMSVHLTPRGGGRGLYVHLTLGAYSIPWRTRPTLSHNGSFTLPDSDSDSDSDSQCSHWDWDPSLDLCNVNIQHIRIVANGKTLRIRVRVRQCKRAMRQCRGPPPPGQDRPHSTPPDRTDITSRTLVPHPLDWTD